MRYAVKPSLYLAIAVAVCTGCGLGTVGSMTVASPVDASAFYHAYGDSITAGYTLASPVTQAYPVLVARQGTLTFANDAIDGDQACDVATRQIFAHANSPSLTQASEYSLLIGTNDVAVKGTGAYEAVFMQCHQAVIAWMGLPVEYKVLATDPAISTAGSGHLDASNNWNAWITGAQGSSISFPITTRLAGPLYAWPRLDDTNPGTYTYSLDGVVMGSGSTQTTPAISTHNGTTQSLGFIRIPAVPAGPHVVTFTQTSAGPNGLAIVGVGAPPAFRPLFMPIVLIGTIPFQEHGDAGGSCSTSDAQCLQYIQDIQADVALLAADGLEIRLFDTRKFMLGTAAEMNDAVHPNSAGQLELSYAIESVF